MNTSVTRKKVLLTKQEQQWRDWVKAKWQTGTPEQRKSLLCNFPVECGELGLDKLTEQEQPCETQ